MRRARSRPVAVVLLMFGVAAAFVARPAKRARLEVGVFGGGFLRGPWSGPVRADLDPPAVADGRMTFYFRSAHTGSEIHLPFVPHGALRLTLRARARVRSAMALFVSGEPAGELLVGTGPWDRHTIGIPEGLVRDRTLVVSLAFRPLPLVAGDHGGSPEVLVDFVEVECDPGMSLSPPALALLAAVPIGVFLFARMAGFGVWAGAGSAAVTALVALALARLSPLAVFLAVPRLLPVALVSGLATRAALERTAVAARERASLACLVAAGVLFHASVAFFPAHNPPDTEIHIRRTRDLPTVGLDYQALLRYGSHLPTASQTFGQATTALGDKTLIPYSPLPYLVYYSLDRAGIDLQWGMTTLNAVAAMAVAPLVWLTAARVWGRTAAWVSALLYVLDLAVWHHLGRSHAPAVFGGALGTAALVWLARETDHLDTPRRVALGAFVLGVAALGYSSLVVLLGLFGLVLLTFLAVDARELTRAARKGMAAVLVAAGMLAGVLYYFHYVPGLLRGAMAVEAEADPFPGRTYFIFHNESRQSLRIWAAGFAVPLVLGLAAAPLAFRRALPAARPVLASWLLAWALIMLLKEPFLFPKLLRWAKEDQFVSPALALLLGGAVGALPRAWMRGGAGAAVVAVALWLEIGDFFTQASSLQL